MARVVILGGYGAVGRGGGGRDVEIGVLLGGGERHGAAAVAWTLDGLADLGPSWRVEFPAPYGTRTVHGFPFSDQRTLPDTLDVDRVRTGLCPDSRLTTALLPAAARFAHRLGRWRRRASAATDLRSRCRRAG
ncbi:hypothetical protein AB0H12_00925 [Actinosynnema sp. NPDC023794]